MRRKPTPGLAKAAYEAWCRSWPKGALSYPAWRDLSELGQCAWVAAAKAVLKVAGKI